MLKELRSVHQRHREPRRRWFQSPDEDLIVWYAEDGSILGFQFCYDRTRNESAVTWRRDRGFAHDKVDSGEESALTYKRTAILAPDGPFNASSVLERFRRAAAELPEDIFDLVCGVLQQYSGGEAVAILRRATPQDAPSISLLVRAAYEHYIERIGKPPRPMLEDYEQEIRRHDVVLAERDGALAGVLVLGKTPEGFKVMNVAVRPGLQKTGVGRALLQFAEAQASRLGYDSIHLSTHEKMTENLALYARIGYREYDRRVEDGYSRVYMRKQLGTA